MFDKLKNALVKTAEVITKKTLTEENLDKILWDFQLALAQNDIAFNVAEEIAQKVKQKLVGQKVGRLEDVKKIIRRAIVDVITEALSETESISIDELASEKKKKGEPLKILFLGINGVGKTTTIAKLAYYFKNKGYSVVMAAADTFRAGSIEQIKHHAEKLNVRVISQQYGSDSAAVAYDAIEHAKAKGVNVVLIDTAGRMQTNKNLIDELKKVKKVVDPDLTILVIDSLAGNDSVEQSKQFNQTIGIDAIILAKVDADEKGGTALSVIVTVKKPILFLGVGQEYKDLVPFDPKTYAEKIIP